MNHRHPYNGVTGVFVYVLFQFKRAGPWFFQKTSATNVQRYFSCSMVTGRSR